MRPRMSTKICDVCYEEFLPPWPTARVCSMQCRLKVWSGGTLDVLWEKTCAYCGDVATTEDHVPPQTLTNRVFDNNGVLWDLKVQCFTVPACRECNCEILGPKPLWTFAERVEYVAEALQVKYARLMDMPEWDDEELEELQDRLRDLIESEVRRQQWAKDRVTFARARAKEGLIWNTWIHTMKEAFSAQYAERLLHLAAQRKSSANPDADGKTGTASIPA